MPRKVVDTPVVSVVIPCLDERETVAACVRTALETLDEVALPGEVVVCDNGSLDGSAAIAEQAGAHVVSCTARGYGNAIRYGVEQSRGVLIVVGDADGSHDFSEIVNFIRPLQEGMDVVIGNRFEGGIETGAMTWVNRYLGNPGLTNVINLFFRTGIHDTQCGFRAFTRDAFKRMKLECAGMEFATEMVIKAAKCDMKMIEIPTAMKAAGRGRPPHLVPHRDGWRHLKFLLMFSPVHLFVLPGAVLAILGLLLVLLPLRGMFQIGAFYLDIHWMVLGVLLVLIGIQVVQFGIIGRLYTVTHHFPERDTALEWFKGKFSLERGLILGAVAFLIGLAIDLWIVSEWIRAEKALQRVRPALLATALMAVGVQTAFFSFLFAIVDRRTTGEIDEASRGRTADRHGASDGDEPVAPETRKSAR